MSSTTVAAHNLAQDWPESYGSSGTYAIFCIQNFVADDGQSYIAGSGDSLREEFVTEASITVVGSLATVASFSLPQTDLARPANVVRYFGRIFDARGGARDYEFENFHMRSSLGASISYLQWVIDNEQTPFRPQVDTKPNTADMNAAIAAAISNAALNQDYVIGSYASFAAAITAITVTGGTLVINAATTCTTNTTVPANISLRFTRKGSLTISNSVTCTIVGPIEADPVKIFFNATAGLGTVSFAGNNVQKDFQVAWWGADSAAAGAATSAALNAAFVAWLDGTTMHLSPHVIYNHAGITIDRKFAATLVGVDTSDGYLDAATAPSFRYSGANGGNAITISNCYATTFKGFSSYGAVTNTVPGTTGATRNLYVTMVASGYPPISSQDVFKSVFVYANNTRSDHIDIDIDNVSVSNNEFHQFLDCKIFGGQQAYPNQTGIGLRLGHANVKQIRIERTSFGGLATAISSSAGSFRGLFNTYDADSIIYGGSFSDATVDIGADSENCTQALVAGGFGANPFTLIAGRYGAMHGGQAVTASTTNLPVFRPIMLGGEKVNLSIIGCVFGGISRFTSDFIVDGTSGQATVYWSPTNSVDISVADLLKGLSTFLTVDGVPGSALNGSGGPITGGGTTHQNSFQGLNSAAAVRALIGVQLDDDAAGAGLVVSTKDSITLGDQGQMEIAGLGRPMRPETSVVGTAGATPYILAVLARDATANRTIPSILNQSITTANATLSGSNYVHVVWPKVPGATDYIVLQFSASTWRTIATVVASGTNTETYDIVTNPAAAYTYVIPTYNETATLKQRGAIVMPVERVFTSLDATPSVIGASDFVTANAGATLITTFDDGIAGQLIRVRVNDANTTLVNGATLANRSGANIVATNGLIYQYIKRGTVWCQL